MKVPKSFQLLWLAAKKSAHPVWQAAKVLIYITIGLAVVFYFAEGLKQPKEYGGALGFLKSLIWAFSQYLGDPGDFSGPGPATVTGRVVAEVIGILNILVFAVPAGMIGSAYSDALAEERRKKELDDFRKRLHKSFKTKQDFHTKFQVVPRYMSMVTIQSEQGMDVKDVLETVAKSKDFRLRNLATTYDLSENPQDRLVLEYFPYSLKIKGARNRPYGMLINRHSKVTIISTSSVQEAGSGHFAYYLALYGNFNYVSKEFEKDPDKPVSYYNISKPNTDEKNQQLFLDDIKNLGMGEDKWIVSILSVPTLADTQFHFVHNYLPKMQEQLQRKTSVIPSKEKILWDLFHEFQDKLRNAKYPLIGDTEQYSNHGILDADMDELYKAAGPKNIATHLGGGKDVNFFTIRILWSITARDSRSTSLTYALAEIMKKHFTGGTITDEDIKQWKRHSFGYDEFLD